MKERVRQRNYMNGYKSLIVKCAQSLHKRERARERERGRKKKRVHSKRNSSRNEAR